jgi:hypothetical protein
MIDDRTATAGCGLKKKTPRFESDSRLGREISKRIDLKKKKKDLRFQTGC